MQKTWRWKIIELQELSFMVAFHWFIQTSCKRWMLLRLPLANTDIFTCRFRSRRPSSRTMVECCTYTSQPVVQEGMGPFTDVGWIGLNLLSKLIVVFSWIAIKTAAAQKQSCESAWCPSEGNFRLPGVQRLGFPEACADFSWRFIRNRVSTTACRGDSEGHFPNWVILTVQIDPGARLSLIIWPIWHFNLIHWCIS